MPTGPHTHALAGDEWRNVTARNAMPLLAWCAQNRAEITYGGLDREIVRRGFGAATHALAYRYAAEDIGHALEDLSDVWDSPVPPLNALIVNQSTGLPGHGVDRFLLRFVRPEERRTELSERDRRILIHRVIDLVHAYDRWPEVLAEFDLRPTAEPVLNVFALEDATPIELPSRIQIRDVRGAGGESEKHRNLKAYVASNPGVLESFHLDTFGLGATEQLLYSGDRLDVLFKGRTFVVAVEVKTDDAPHEEIVRGIFQCVKYEAVLQAELIAESRLPRARAILVSGRKLTAGEKALARRLNVPFKHVRPRRLPSSVELDEQSEQPA